MPYQATVYRVMIASPGDVNEERQIAREVVLDWNSTHSESTGKILMPTMWERDTAPEMGIGGQESIDKQLLKKCDLLVAMFWSRLGTPVGKDPSGTAYELREHVERGKPAMLYFSKADLPGDADLEQAQAVRDFRSNLIKKDAGLIRSYDDIHDFRDKLKSHLAMTLNENDAFQKSSLDNRSFESITDFIFSLPKTQEIELTDGEKRIIVEMSKDPKRIVLRFKSGGINTTKTSLFDGENPDMRIEMDGYLENLKKRNLIRLESSGTAADSYILTKTGLDEAKKLETDQSHSLPEDEARLVAMTAADPDGNVYSNHKVKAHAVVITNKQYVVSEKTARAKAYWDNLIIGLIKKGILKAGDITARGKEYQLTHKGFELADKLKADLSE